MLPMAATMPMSTLKFTRGERAEDQTLNAKWAGLPYRSSCRSETLLQASKAA